VKIPKINLQLSVVESPSDSGSIALTIRVIIAGTSRLMVDRKVGEKPIRKSLSSVCSRAGYVIVIIAGLKERMKRNRMYTAMRAGMYSISMVIHALNF
jgi:hypothetical protein